MYIKDEGILTKIIEKKLDSDEQIEKIIKVIDKTESDFIEASSMTGGTLGNLIVYGLFKNIYFTNKRIFLVDINEVNENILDTDYELTEIVDIRFTNNHIKVEQNDEGEYFVKEGMPKAKKIEITLACIFLALILLIYFHSAKCTAVIVIIGILCCLAVFIKNTIREDTIDEIEVDVKEGKTYKMLIAGEDYAETKEYMHNRLEN